MIILDARLYDRKRRVSDRSETGGAVYAVYLLHRGVWPPDVIKNMRFGLLKPKRKSQAISACDFCC